MEDSGRYEAGRSSAPPRTGVSRDWPDLRRPGIRGRRHHPPGRPLSSGGRYPRGAGSDLPSQTDRATGARATRAGPWKPSVDRTHGRRDGRRAAPVSDAADERRRHRGRPCERLGVRRRDRHAAGRDDVAARRSILGDRTSPYGHLRTTVAAKRHAAAGRRFSTTSPPIAVQAGPDSQEPAAWIALADGRVLALAGSAARMGRVTAADRPLVGRTSQSAMRCS